MDFPWKGREGSTDIVVPHRVQARARRAVQHGMMSWVDEICRELPAQVNSAIIDDKSKQAALKEAEIAAQTLLAMVTEYRRSLYPDA